MKVRYDENGVYVLMYNDAIAECFQGTEAQAESRLKELKENYFINTWKTLNPYKFKEHYDNQIFWHIKEADLTRYE